MVITKIEVQKRDPQRANIFLDGSYGFSFSIEGVYRFSLKKGKELSLQEKAELESFDRGQKAKKKALDLLSRRAHSKEELEKKLIQKGFDIEESEKVVAELSEKGYQSDEDFARQMVAMGKKKLWPNKKIRYELQGKGIESHIIEQILEEEGEGEKERALAAFEKACRGKNWQEAGVKKKIIDSLLRKGFSYGMIAPLFLEQEEWE